MSKAKQAKLFDTLPLPPGLSTQPMILGPSKDLDPEQRRFNRLSKEVQTLREDLARLQAKTEHFRQILLREYLPRVERLQAARIGLVKALDALLTRPQREARLTRKQREGLEAFLLWMLEPLMQEIQDPELVAIHDRHSPISAAEGKELERDLERAIVEDMFGPDALDGFEGEGIEDMLAYAKARQDENRAQAQAGKSASATRKAFELAQTQQEAHHAVREVYRRLASQLHPDREADEALRQQKTDLMQRANQAYEKGDLLTLLTLQLECEQLDADRLAELPLDRLKRYNHALKEQVRALKEEKAEIFAQLAEMLELSPHGLSYTTDAMLEERLKDKIESIEHSCAEIEGWSAGLADPAKRDGVIKMLLQEMANFEDELGLHELAQLFMDHTPEPAPSAKPKAQRNKQRNKKSRTRYRASRR